MPKNCSSSSRAARIFSSPEISFWPLLKLGAARRAAPFLNIDNRGQGRVRARNEKIETGRDRVMNKKAYWLASAVVMALPQVSNAQEVIAEEPDGGDNRSEEHTSELQS